MAKVIELRDIAPSATRTGNDNATGYHAQIVRNESIRVFGNYCGKDRDRTFRLGDMAEYGSYNLSYYGPIVGITDKTVTIEERHGPAGERRRHRLSIYKFWWRNCNFDLDKTIESNAEISMTI